MPDEGKLEVDLVSPEKKVFSKSADMVIISGSEGDFGVLPGHASIISSLRPGALEVQDSNNIETLFVSGGIVEVLADRVSILATEVLSKDEIKVDECESKINNYMSEIQSSSDESDKEKSQKLVDKYQSMIDFKNL
tara:strand:+ start:17327 stop:17734 length:408 start_codon:yes stop_codon:yes gene_type:complete